MEMQGMRGVPKQVYALSRDMRLVWHKQVLVGNPWENITGKLEVGRRVRIEKLLKEKGFENAGGCF
jgi:hypothetical protein